MDETKSKKMDELERYVTRVIREFVNGHITILQVSSGILTETIFAIADFPENAREFMHLLELVPLPIIEAMAAECHHNPASADLWDSLTVKGVLGYPVPAKAIGQVDLKYLCAAKAISKIVLECEQISSHTRRIELSQGRANVRK